MDAFKKLADIKRMVSETCSSDNCGNMDGFGDNKGDKQIVIECRDPDGRIKNLLDYIKSTANIGHSFPVIVASESDHKKEFYIDGDGPDYIYSIKEKAKGWVRLS